MYFKLYNNDEIVFEVNKNINRNNNILGFQNENDNYIINIEKNTIIKKNLESKVLIDLSNKNINLLLYDNNYELNINLINVKVEKSNENLITYEYEIDGENDLKIRILIKL